MPRFADTCDFCSNVRGPSHKRPSQCQQNSSNFYPKGDICCRRTISNFQKNFKKFPERKLRKHRKKKLSMKQQVGADKGHTDRSTEQTDGTDQTRGRPQSPIRPHQWTPVPTKREIAVHTVLSVTRQQENKRPIQKYSNVSIHWTWLFLFLRVYFGC